MKNTDIAAAVFKKLASSPLTDVSGGPVTLPVADLGGLALVPWFCDVSVQWAVRLSEPGKPLKKTLLKKVNDSYITEANGAVLIGVPGDGIEPSTFTLFPLAEAIAKVVRPGMLLELGTANLGTVKRDWEVKAESNTTFGDQHFAGPIQADGRWSITQSSPALSQSQLELALSCGVMVLKNGPWKVRDRKEAGEILLAWMHSPEANMNPVYVQRMMALKDGAIVSTNAQIVRKLYGLGLGFFRTRLTGGPFQWTTPASLRWPEKTYQDIVKAVAG